MFGLCHAGIFAERSYVEPIKEQIRFYLNLIPKLSKIGIAHNIRVYLSDIRVSTYLIQKSNLAME